MTSTHARRRGFGLAATIAALALAACTRTGEGTYDPAATASAETVDMIASDAASCPAIKQMLTRALADNRITQGEARDIAVRTVKLGDASDLADSYDAARRAAGLSAGPPHRRCYVSSLRNLAPR